MDRSIVVAITGGIGTGKTTVSELIAAMGYPVISSDNAAKELMVKDLSIREKLVAEFGREFYLPDGEVNKSYVAQLVFGDDEKSADNLAKLNSIVHPVVIDNMIQSVEKHELQGEKIIFVESALTFEAGLDDGFDFIIVVDAPEDICIERVQKRSGLNEKQIRQRMNTQLPQQDKVNNSDFVIDNGSTPEKLKQSVEFVIMVLKNIDPNELDEDDGD